LAKVKTIFNVLVNNSSVTNPTSIAEEFNFFVLENL